MNAIKNPNTRGIAATLAVALTSGFLFLMTDRNFAIKTWNPQISVYQVNSVGFCETERQILILTTVLGNWWKSSLR